MQARGFSLIEMIVVMAIVSVLLAIGTLRFNDYLKQYRTEAQTRLLYSELLRARVNAIYQRKAIRVKLYPGRFEVYSSQQDDTRGAKPLQTHALRYPVTCSATMDPVQGYRIDFEANGQTFDECSICLDPSAGSGAVDSLKVARTRMSIGKKDKGDECMPDNITVK